MEPLFSNVQRCDGATESQIQRLVQEFPLDVFTTLVDYMEQRGYSLVIQPPERKRDRSVR